MMVCFSMAHGSNASSIPVMIVRIKYLNITKLLLTLGFLELSVALIQVEQIWNI
jgi:hypothetical protein